MPGASTGCPSGWTKSAGEGGSFSCTPKKPKLACPADLEYYERDCEIGCRNPAPK